MLSSATQILPSLIPVSTSKKLSKALNYLPTTTTATDSGLLFRQKVLYLTSLNINPQKALSLNPNFRSTPLSTLHSVVLCLSSFGLHRSSIGRILDMHPSLLTSHPDIFLYPVLDFLLHDVSLPFPDIPISLIRCPRLLVSSVPCQLRPALHFLSSLGFVGPSAIDCQTTVLLVYNVESTLKPKIKYLMTLGFEYEEVKQMVVRSPGLLTLSVERNLVPKIDYFLGDMRGDLAELKRFPQYFSFSLEGKIKPRHRMLVEHGLKLPLWKMLKVSDGEFNARLVEMRLGMVSEHKRRKSKKLQKS